MRQNGENLFEKMLKITPMKIQNFAMTRDPLTYLMAPCLRHVRITTFVLRTPPPDFRTNDYSHKPIIGQIVFSDSRLYVRICYFINIYGPIHWTTFENYGIRCTKIELARLPLYYTIRNYTARPSSSLSCDRVR